MNPEPSTRVSVPPVSRTILVVIAITLFGGTFAAGGDRPDYQRSAYERVCQAQDEGSIGLKQAVLEKSRLLFAPEQLDPGSAFAPRQDEVAVFEECLTGFYKDVHRAAELLDAEERGALSALSPDLATILRRDSGGGGSPEGLPNYPFLDKTETGKSCIVHYTLNAASPHKVPNKTYAELVRLYTDMAIKKLTRKHFTKALADGYAGFKGKLHVYVLDINGNGEWVDAAAAGGNKMAGYIKISHSLKADYGNTWQLKMKGVCTHEYFHGVQSAYNAWSDLWFLEGTAVWASCIYGGDWAHVRSYYDAGGSLFTAPDQVIWQTTYRKYSTSALAFYLHNRYRGWKFFKAYFNNSIGESDAVKNLKATISAKGGSWDQEFRKFLACVVTRKLGVLKKKYVPKVATLAVHGAYGVDPTNASVNLTGADFVIMNPQSAKSATFIATFETSASNPYPFLLRKGKTSPIGFTAGKAHIGGFGKKVKQVILIVTDTTYAGKDAAKRNYKYSAIVPWVKVKRIVAQSPIYSGQSSQIDITYDLTGTYPTQPFPVDIKVVEKGPGVSDHVSGTYMLNVGLGQVKSFWFNTSSGTRGTYKFAFEYGVPPKSWNMPQVKSKDRCTVVVKKPPGPEQDVGELSLDRLPRR